MRGLRHPEGGQVESEPTLRILEIDDQDEHTPVRKPLDERVRNRAGGRSDLGNPAERGEQALEKLAASVRQVL